MEGSRDTVQRNMPNKVQARLKELIPGSCNAVAAIKCADGRLVTSTPSNFAELRRHWSEVFTARSIDTRKLIEWLSEDLQEKPPWTCRDTNLDVTVSDMAEVVAMFFWIFISSLIFYDTSKMLY